MSTRDWDRWFEARSVPPPGSAPCDLWDSLPRVDAGIEERGSPLRGLAVAVVLEAAVFGAAVLLIWSCLP